MDIPQAKIIVFRDADGTEVNIPEPTVDQIERLLKYESSHDGDDKYSSVSAKLGILVAGPPPPLWCTREWVLWRWTVARRRRWLRRMTYPAMTVVLNTLLAAANGIDVASIGDLVSAAAEKKTTLNPKRSTPSTKGGSTTSPKE